MTGHNYYLFLNIISIVFPIILSFDKNVQFYKLWKYAIPAILCTSVIFIPWDAYFTIKSVWGFNEQYLTGIELFGLPLEENLFFFTVPFACVFVYECVRFYLPSFINRSFGFLPIILLIGFNCVSIFLFIQYFGRWYSMSAIGGCLIFVNFAFFYYRKYMGFAFVSYLFICIPFLLINGALTGMFTENPVVWYNPTGFSEIRVITIPMEDFYYNALLVGSSLFFYHLFGRRVG